MTDTVIFEIVKCVNPSPCHQRPLVLTVNGLSRRLTGDCGGPFETVRAYRVRVDDLLDALRAAQPDREAE